MDDQAVSRLRRILDQPDLASTRYRLIEEVARGGMGAIWCAVDTELDRRVALKVLHAWDETSAESAGLLQREARTLAGLEHPGIVPVHDAGTLPDGRVFYAMKLVQGRRLDSAVEGMPRAERLRLFQRVCEPVQFAHSRGVIHRDLKPDNVMVGEFGEVLVMDWGVAKIAGLSGERGVIGTPEYMAPEQAAGENDRVGPRTDVYGLGGILQFLLSGQRLPKPLAAICRAATAGDQNARYASVAELAADVGRFLDGEPVTAYRENPIEIAMRWTNRHQTLVLLVLAYLVMRVLLLYFLGH
jgi:eukaryotic-like serine/threonine-protein kinase